jgi:hypothetical protein
LRISKVPRRRETETTAKLGEEYLRRRNRILAIKEKREAMELAFARDELIDRELVIRQLSYLMIAMRQRLLGLPAAMRYRFDEEFTFEMIAGARELVCEALNELADMPQRGVDPDWLSKLEEEK